MMEFLFRRYPRTSKELVTALNDQAVKLETCTDPRRPQEEISRHLSAVREVLANAKDNPDQLLQLSLAVYDTDCLLHLLQHLESVEFDARKNVTMLFSSLLNYRVSGRSPAVDYLTRRPEILSILIRGLETSDISINTRIMLEEALKSREATQMVLNSQKIWQLLRYCNSNSFETSTDALAVVTKALTVHKSTVSGFFTLENSWRFIQNANGLIVSSSYVTQRESLRLLSKLLLTKENYTLLTTYVNSGHNLKLAMILLGSTSKNICLDAFDVFKVFVANPHKSPEVASILSKNREKLLTLLRNLNGDKKTSEQFKVERAFVISQIEALEVPQPPLKISASNTKSDIPKVVKVRTQPRFSGGRKYTAQKWMNPDAADSPVVIGETENVRRQPNEVVQRTAAEPSQAPAVTTIVPTTADE